MLEFQRGFFFSISNLLCICIIHAFDIWAPFAFLHFTTVNFPVQKQRVPVCEIFGLVWPLFLHLHYLFEVLFYPCCQISLV